MRGMELFTGAGRQRLAMRGMELFTGVGRCPELSCPIVWTPPCGGAHPTPFVSSEVETPGKAQTPSHPQALVIPASGEARQGTR
jgi:hypothetical protein